MISILIPIYKYDVRSLVFALHKEVESLGESVEIILMDDGSIDDYCTMNQELSSLQHIRYEELPQNIGRSKIRNRLASQAQYQNLIFLDCDVMPEKENFLATYLEHVKYDVVCGGRTYEATPKNEQFILHWTYGKNREVKSARYRQLKPNRSFMTNNFMIKRSIMLDIPFNETITEYGHEDTLFGYDLKQNKIKIHHIDNPAIHIGLDENTSFIEKSELAIKNLAQLIEQKKISNEFARKNITIFKFYTFLKKTGLLSSVQRYYKSCEPNILKNLHSQQPSLRYFDLFRLDKLINQIEHRS